MKKFLLIVITLTLCFTFSQPARSQEADTTMYLITCGPGTETYSIYGHSALLVDIGGKKTVYNWGVFDFDTPNFAWKFAKGRLDYMLGHESLEGFLRSYFYEERHVLSQKINIEQDEKRKIMELVLENLKPENISYRYDFFYDDCSTRIRDLIEKALGDNLIYPEPEASLPTFRQLIAEFQRPYKWLQFGVDLLIGSTAEREAGLREQMFLPDYLMTGLTSAQIKRNGETIPLLNRAEMLLDFDPVLADNSYITSPFFVFSMLLILVAFLTFKLKSPSSNNLLDFIIFFIFSVLAVLMIFFNFFTDHEQLRQNYNILWLNPFIIVLFFAILTGKGDKLWSRIIFLVTAIFILVHLFIPQAFHLANYPLILIILLRSMVRGEFNWSPVRVQGKPGLRT